MQDGRTEEPKLEGTSLGSKHPCVGSKHPCEGPQTGLWSQRHERAFMSLRKVKLGSERRHINGAAVAPTD